tara:strand:- start:21099 stop:21647 length:549 start_codon:yes stop_codon:yes gene_type:complete
MDKAIFLDRDGTLNNDGGYTYKTEDFSLIDGVMAALKLLKNDFKFFIVTNQSGIGRGYFTIDDVNKFNDIMLEEFKKHGIEIEKIYICPHKPEDNCGCRKPNAKYIKDAENEFDIDIKNSWAIGDHSWDVGMGINAGCNTVYVLTGHGEKHKEDLKREGIKPDFIAGNLYEAAKIIMEKINK